MTTPAYPYVFVRGTGLLRHSAEIPPPPTPYIGIGQFSGHSRTPLLVCCPPQAHCRVCGGRVKQREQRYGKETDRGGN